MPYEPLDTEWSSPIPPTCEKCGYDLRGLPSFRCPECGHVTPRTALKQAARETSIVLIQLRNINANLRYGFYAGLGGVLVVILASAAGLGGLSMLLGLFIGLGTVGGGLQVFRALRVPLSTRELLPVKPRYTEGILVVTLGLALIFLSVLLA